MAFVAINLLEVPDHMRGTLEDRFAARAGLVEQTDGFQSFELLRPIAGSERYLVYTRWDSKESFDAWMSSQAFQRGHAQHASDGPAATGSESWTFDVVQAASRTA